MRASATFRQIDTGAMLMPFFAISASSAGQPYVIEPLILRHCLSSIFFFFFVLFSPPFVFAAISPFLLPARHFSRRHDFAMFFFASVSPFLRFRRAARALRFCDAFFDCEVCPARCRFAMLPAIAARRHAADFRCCAADRFRFFCYQPVIFIDFDSLAPFSCRAIRPLLRHFIFIYYDDAARLPPHAASFTPRREMIFSR